VSASACRAEAPDPSLLAMTEALASSRLPRFTGKVVVATGAANGLGLAAARQFASEGATLVLVDWDAEALATTGAAIRSQTGAHVELVCGDASDAATARAAIDRARSLGGPDILFNNAGIDPLPATTVPGTSEEEFDRVMRVNVRSVFVFSRTVLPHFIERARGVIVNTASIAGLMACPAEAAYATSKAAVVNLTRAMALDHAGQGVRINCVCPGVLEGVMVDRRREMTREQIDGRHASESGSPMRRAGSYEEVARSVLFLASDDASYCNGTALVVDGGMTSGYSGHGTTVWSLAGSGGAP